MRDESQIDIWRDIPGFEGYQAGYNGSIRRRLKSGKYRTLNPFYCGGRKDHLHVKLYAEDGRYKTMTVASAVASAYLGERPEGCRTHHRNGLTTDNCVGNLCYVKASEIGVISGRMHRRPVVKKDEDGTILECYNSVTEAARKNYVTRSAMTQRCNKNLRTDFGLGGYEFAWDDE